VTSPQDKYEVVFSPAARRDLHNVPPRIVPAIIEFAYGDLAAAPRRVGKPLMRDLEGSYSARRGPYRLIYEIDDADRRIAVLRVDHRSDVYRPRP
jgi:mRNA interferase RelE/StbE